MSQDDSLSRPNLLGRSPHFSALTIALVFADPKAALVVKAVLDSLGCRAIVLARDGKELFDRLKREVIDIAVIDSGLKSMTGIECVRQIRQLPGSNVRDMPVILLGHSKNKEDIATVRDAGATEYMHKPFTAQALLASVHMLVERPRAFIISAGYTGPDRRVQSSFTSLLPATSRTKCVRSQTPQIIKSLADAAQMKEGTPLLIHPDWRLKRKMGLSVPEPLVETPVAIERVENAMDQAKEAFAASIQEEVSEILAYCRLLIQRPDRTAFIIEAIRMTASVIESRTLDLGYRRVPEVARLLREFCEQHFVIGNEFSLILLERHALTLMAMLQAGQAGDMGKAGDSLLKDLARQVAKYNSDSLQS
ncbi:response regulator [bacterium]|nr:response regulator [bacterium]